MTNRARVALLRTTPATALQDYARLIELAELQRSLDPSATTALVLDLRRHFPFPAANTAPWQLEGVARALHDAGYRDRVYVQSRTAIISAFKGQDLNGYTPILRACGVVELPAAGTPQPRLTPFHPKRPLPALERVCEGDFNIPAYLLGANVVYLPTLKTDRAATVGGAVCCAAGGLLTSWSRAGRGRVHELLADLLAIQREVCAGVAAVMDGTTAGNGPGPYALRPEVKNVILASADPVALDAVAAQMMGFDPLRDVAHLRLAHERGLGVADPRAITLVGDADLAHEHWHFSAGGQPRLDLLGMLDRLAMGTPLAGPLGLATESYRDFYRWPLKERQVFESWLQHTAWGRLFEHYQRIGYHRS
ncbi:MAG: DUF362 domain-containing protein [Roseiflexaceae bacterium]